MAAYQGARARSFDVFVDSYVREIYVGTVVGGLLLPLGWAWKAYRLTRLGQAATAIGEAAATLTVDALSVTQRTAYTAFRGLLKTLPEHATKSGTLSAPFRWVGNSWQRKALEDYLETVFLKYVQRHPDGIKVLAGAIRVMRVKSSEIGI
jgi:hypothetical protein